MDKSCVKCGSAAELLLNLVCCSGSRCQNFDQKFYSKWLGGCGRTYNVPNKDWAFLGRYVSKKATNNKVAARIYDLYRNGPEVYAIYSNVDGEIFAGDAEGKPLGYYQFWWQGKEMVDENGKDALLEAAARKSL